MKTEITRSNVNDQLHVTIDCSTEELRRIGEGLQMAHDEATQKFGTYIVKQVNKIQSK